MLKCFCCHICDDLLTVRFLLTAYFLHPWRNFFFLLLKNLLYNGGCISKISVSVRHCSLITIGLNGHCPQIFSVLFQGICSISSVKYLVHKPNWKKKKTKKTHKVLFWTLIIFQSQTGKEYYLLWCPPCFKCFVLFFNLFRQVSITFEIFLCHQDSFFFMWSLFS